MKLLYSETSPFVRKCLVTAHELGIAARLELKPAAAHPVNRDRSVVEKNPLGKIPTLVTDEGTVLFDSRVICEYLNALGDGHLLPAAGQARFVVLTDQALADGLLGTIALGCALGYLDFRYDDFGWRERHPSMARWYEQFAARESMTKTRPPAA